MNQNGNEGSNSTKKMLPGRKRDYEHHNARREGTNNSKNVELSPQPPRVMSVQERKQILLRRSNSRTGIGWKRSRFNDSTRSARNLSTRFSDSIAQSSQSATATSTVDMSEDNRSKRFRKSRNSLFLNDSQCSESTNIISSSTILDESRLPSGATSSLQTSALGDGKHLSSPNQDSKQGENTKFTMYSSPRPNESDKKNPTPSSLFGEIMKRLPLSPTRTNSTSTHKAASQDTPSPISNRLELDILDDKKVENGEPQILFDPKESSPISRKPYRSLVPSIIARRPTNIFKQYSKSSKPAGSISEAASINRTHSQTKRTSIFNSPKQDRKSSPHSSPIINKSSLSQFSTPERNQSNSISWDVNTPTTAYKGPLFKRSPMTPEQKTSSTVTSKKGVLSAKSPDRKTNTRANWSPNTPDSSRLQRGSPKQDRYHNSPGGMTLLRALNGCMSPKILYKNGTGEGDGSKSSVGSTSKGQHDEWKECFVNLPSFVQHNDEDIQDAEFLPTKKKPTHLDLVRGQVGFIDWSLKRGMKIDCYPDDCIPGTPLNNDIDTNAPSSDFSFRTKGSRNHHRIDRMAMDIFMNPNTRVESFKSEQEGDIAMAQWKSALMYWQHPVVHPMPPSVLSQISTPQSIVNKLPMSRSNSVDSKATKKEKNTEVLLQRQSSLPAKSLANNGLKRNSRAFQSGKNWNEGDLFASVSGANAPLRQSQTRASLGSLGGLGESSSQSKNVSTLSAMIDQRMTEWQECFRSLFMNWLHRIHELNATEDMDDSVFNREEIHRHYFYCISPGCTTLMRANEYLDETIGEIPKSKLEPMILLSSSTKASRSSMRAMNIRFKTVNSEGEWKMEVPEDLVRQWSESTERKEDTANLHLREELEALRRATTHESVGAEVSISMAQRKKGKENRHPSTFKPLIIKGHDDCTAFFEVYLNTFGKLSHDDPGKCVMKDVPLLLSRSITARHMNVRYLKSSIQHHHDNNNDDSHKVSSVDIHGPILPCAAGDILCASACHFSLRKKITHRFSGGAAVVEEPQGNGDENILGSHYFILYPRVHKGEEELTGIKRANTSSRRIGISSSMWFNGIKCSQVAKNEDTIDVINNGEISVMAVWDIDRPHGIALQSSKCDE